MKLFFISRRAAEPQIFIIGAYWEPSPPRAAKAVSRLANVAKALAKSAAPLCRCGKQCFFISRQSRGAEVREAVFTTEPGG